MTTHPVLMWEGCTGPWNEMNWSLMMGVHLVRLVPIWVQGHRQGRKVTGVVIITRCWVILERLLNEIVQDTITKSSGHQFTCLHIFTLTLRHVSGRYPSTWTETWAGPGLNLRYRNLCYLNVIIDSGQTICIARYRTGYQFPFLRLMKRVSTNWTSQTHTRHTPLVTCLLPCL